MGYYFRKISYAFVYLIITMATGFMIGVVLRTRNDDGQLMHAMAYGNLFLGIVNIMLYAFSVFLIFYKEGQKAYQTRDENDIYRRRMIETGQVYTLKTAEEYKPYKGFIMGLVCCVPLIILLIVHLILGLTSGGELEGAGIAAGSIYMTFYLPLKTIVDLCGVTNAQFNWTYFFILLYCVPVISCITGVPYILGARKTAERDRKIAEKNRQIYGE